MFSVTQRKVRVNGFDGVRTDYALSPVVWLFLFALLAVGFVLFGGC